MPEQLFGRKVEEYAKSQNVSLKISILFHLIMMFVTTKAKKMAKTGFQLYIMPHLIMEELVLIKKPTMISN